MRTRGIPLAAAQERTDAGVRAGGNFRRARRRHLTHQEDPPGSIIIPPQQAGREAGIDEPTTVALPAEAFVGGAEARHIQEKSGNSIVRSSFLFKTDDPVDLQKSMQSDHARLEGRHRRNNT